MGARTPFEEEVINTFLAMAFPPGLEVTDLPPDEQAVVDEVYRRVETNFYRTKYLLGLTVDFAMTAEYIACQEGHGAAKAFRPALTETELFSLYPKKPKASRSGGTQKTLSVTYAPKKYIGIRRFEDRVVQLSRDLNRTSYPSAPPFNTQSWADFPEIMLSCFQLSESGRLSLIKRLFESLFEWLPEDKLFGRQTQRPKLFLDILRVPYLRNPGTRTENAGLTLQAIAYGYIQADRGHLSISVDKVRSGSSRQRRFGDVDGYFGVDIEVSVEVKDLALTAETWRKELGTFAKKVNYNQIDGLAIVADITDEARRELTATTDRLQILTLAELVNDVRLWDWRKQDNALNAMLHYLSHVEQNVFAVQRLLGFVADRDPNHDMLAYREQVNRVAAVTDEVQPTGIPKPDDGDD